MRTFRNRLLVLIIGLVVAAQTVTLFAVLARTGANMRARASEQLTAGASVARQLIEFRATQLSNAVGVLAADFGLREAVASGERTTISSAARNHGRRIGADLLLVLDVDGALLSSSHGETALDPAITRTLMQEPGAARGGTSFLRLGDEVFQILAAPVRAPDPIGWVAIGFSVDRQLALEIRDLVNVEIAFLTQDSAGGRIVATSLDERARRELDPLAGELLATRASHAMGAESSEFLVTSELFTAGRHGLAVALLKPMHAVNAPYREIRDTLWVIAGLAVALAVAVGSILGRGATRPIDRLVAGARRIERGDYGTPIEISGGEEFERLASTFNAMQHGIAEREARIMHQAHHDPVTGLPNRQRFELEFTEAAARDTHPVRTAIALIEICNLRQFSGSLGFEFADQVLGEVGRRLGQDAREGWIVARLEGGRFALAARDLRRARAEALLSDICSALRAGVRVVGLNVRLELAAGLALAPEHGDAAAELLRRAEIALDEARARQLTVAIFAPEQDHLQARRLQLSADLPEAIESGRLTLVYQAKVTMAERRVRSAEVLARWTHGTLGPVSPGEFVPLAEHTGAANMLTRWVLRQALRQLATWYANGHTLDLAVNLSAADIADPGLPDYVLGELRANKLPATALVLEITESAVMRDVEAAALHMEQLRFAGVRFAIDDFGTGYSSLSQLKRLPVDELKIDKSFVHDATRDEDDAAIVRSTIELGHSMGLRVVAEGVETEEQWRLLDQLGCDFAQGYLISRPIGALEFGEYLQRTKERLEAASSHTSEFRALQHQL